MSLEDLLQPNWKPRKDGSFLRAAALRFACVLEPLLVRCGVDGPQMRSILELRMTLESRGPDGKTSGFASLGLVLTILMAWLSGLPVGIAAVAKMQPGAWMTLVSAQTLFFVGMMLFTQYGPLLVDGTDVAVLQSRPVADRTLFTARLVHVAAYVGFLVMALVFWPLCLGWLGAPLLYIVVVPVVVVLTAMLTVGLVALAYALVLRIAGPVSFQRAAFWMQLAGAASFFAVIQMVSHVMRIPGIGDWFKSDSWTHVLVPPFLFGALFDVLLGRHDAHSIVMASLALVLPLLAIAAAVALAGRHFVTALAGEIGSISKRSGWPRGAMSRCGALLSRSRGERAAWDFVGAHLLRDRHFLRAAAPMVGGLAAGLLAFSGSARIMPEWLCAVLPAMYLYLLALVLPALVEASRYGEHPNARWIWQAAPVGDTRAIVRGHVLRVWFTLHLPMLVLTSLVVLFFAGSGAIPHLAIAMLGSSALGFAAVRRAKAHLPFSAQPIRGDFDGRTVSVMFGILVASCVAAAAHFLASLHPIAFLAWSVWVVIATIVTWRDLAHLPEARVPELDEPMSATGAPGSASR